MYIDRNAKKLILENLQAGKVLVLFGARRVGKTKLIQNILREITEPYLLLNGEDISTWELLERRTVKNYISVLAGKRLLIIDEAQKIPQIGIKLKLMVDEIEGLRIIITGSSAFDISEKTGEPLTGRQILMPLYPLSEAEFLVYETAAEKYDNLHKRLIYGNYPELQTILGDGKKAEYLNDLVNSLLLKDILTLENIRNSSKLISLIRLIAFQIGGEVSVHELAKQLQISRQTVEKYLDLFTKVFILFKIEGFSRNLRKEVVKSSKWYFYDNGIRNAVIANFNSITQRGDIGQLWENYIISERVKFQQTQRTVLNQYFWRTYDGQEIDRIEERSGKLYAYEIKYSKGKVKVPGGWGKAYPDAVFSLVNKENYLSFVTGTGEMTSD